MYMYLSTYMRKSVGGFVLLDCEVPWAELSSWKCEVLGFPGSDLSTPGSDPSVLS